MSSLRFPVILASILLFGFALCQIPNDLDVDDIERHVKDNFPGLEGFNSSQLPSEEDLEKVLREKCKENGGGDEAFDALKNQQTVLQQCLEKHLNASEIQMEIEESKKTGSMDEVFGKYCNKYPEIYKCFETVHEMVQPCLNNQEKEAMEKALNITGELKEFVCFKDGDRIAMFIAEGGLECLEDRKDALQECANKTIGERIPTELTVNSLPMFLFSERDCRDFQTIRACINVELEKCAESTPANIVDAFFKFLSKHMPCGAAVANPETLKTTKASSASSFFNSIYLSFVSAAVLFVALL